MTPRLSPNCERGTLLTTSGLARRADRSLAFVRSKIARGEIRPMYRTGSGAALFAESAADALRRAPAEVETESATA